MANSNGIFKRGSSHYLRVVLPKTDVLRNTYKSGKVIVSLGACSYREALTAATIKKAQILEAKELTTKAAAPTKSAMFRYLTVLGNHCNLFYKELKPLGRPPLGYKQLDL